MIVTKIIILIFVSSILSSDYGYYCGLGHTNAFGVEPIDSLDRACQIHDICINDDILNCFCNEQLFYSVSNFNPTNIRQYMEKYYILTSIYRILSICKSEINLNTKYLIGNTAGYNFIPIYPNKQKIISYFVSNQTDILLVNKEYYNEFAIYINMYPTNFTYYFNDYSLINDQFNPHFTLNNDTILIFVGGYEVYFIEQILEYHEKINNMTLCNNTKTFIFDNKMELLETLLVIAIFTIILFIVSIIFLLLTIIHLRKKVKDDETELFDIDQIN